MLEVMLRLDRSKGLLNIDIQNMFNTLCRTALMEDIMDSKNLLGCDFTHLAAYIDMTYGNDSDLWFKLDAAEDGETVLRDRGKKRAKDKDAKDKKKKAKKTKVVEF